MPEFIMSREGEVNGVTVNELPEIMQGYVEALFFTNCSGISMVDWASEESQEAVREGTSDGSIPADADWGDIHPDSAIRMHTEVMEFQKKARHLLSQAYLRGYDAIQAGRDFWFTRNGHGVGFWDRKELENQGVHEAHGFPRVGDPTWAAYKAASENSLGDQLTAIATTFGESNASFDEGEGSPTGYGFVYVD
jgi:hypothetical protein